MLLFKTLCTAVLPLVVISATSTISTTIGSVVVSPLDYAQYADTIDLQFLRYSSSSGNVFFVDNNHTVSSNSSTTSVKNAAILSSGQFKVDDGTANDDYYLTVNDLGLVSVTTDATKINGIFSIEDGVLSYNYHSNFIACELEEGKYSLLWKEAGASCDSETWLLVKLKTYSSSSGAVSAYFPDNYVSSIASTAMEDVYTTTTTTMGTSASVGASSANGVMKFGVGAGAGVAGVGAAMLLL